MKVSDKISGVFQGKTQVCEACGGELTCGPVWSCWCTRENVPKETLVDLKARYKRCLCPDCLRKAAAQTTSD